MHTSPRCSHTELSPSTEPLTALWENSYSTLYTHLRQERWSFPFQGQRKRKLRRDGCTDIGGFQFGEFAFNFNSSLEIPYRKVNGRPPASCFTLVNKNFFECKITLFPCLISVVPTQHKLRHHLAKCY